MIANRLKLLLYGLYVVSAAAVIGFAVPQTGFKALTVATGSMTPAIPQGSLVIIERTPLAAIHAGDVITYQNPINRSQTITHRVVKVGKAGSALVFQTKGDANRAPDRQIAGGSVVGRVAYHIPLLGRVASWLHTPLGLVLLVGLPAALIIASELRLMVRRLQQISFDEVRKGMKLRKPLLYERTQRTPTAAPLQPSGYTHTRSNRQVRAHLPSRRRPRPVVWMALPMLIGLSLSLVAAGDTRAQLSSSVRLVGNTITTQAAGTKPGSCPAGTTSVSISNTGPGSSNSVTSHTSCSTTSTGSTSVTVDNSSTQTATTGEVSGSGNNTSGTASNSSSSSTSVNIGH